MCPRSMTSRCTSNLGNSSRSSARRVGRSTMMNISAAGSTDPAPTILEAPPSPSSTDVLGLGCAARSLVFQCTTSAAVGPRNVATRCLPGVGARTFDSPGCMESRAWATGGTRAERSSGGQQQRVAVARALSGALDPRCEPTAILTPAGAEVTAPARCRHRTDRSCQHPDLDVAATAIGKSLREGGRCMSPPSSRLALSRCGRNDPRH